MVYPEDGSTSGIAHSGRRWVNGLGKLAMIGRLTATCLSARCSMASAFAADVAVSTTCTTGTKQICRRTSRVPSTRWRLGSLQPWDATHPPSLRCVEQHLVVHSQVPHRCSSTSITCCLHQLSSSSSVLSCLYCWLRMPVLRTKASRTAPFLFFSSRPKTFLTD